MQKKACSNTNNLIRRAHITLDIIMELNLILLDDFIDIVFYKRIR
jgi:hypothetical protein